MAKSKYGFLKYGGLIFVVENPPEEGADYFYEENRCPVDVFRMVIEVIDPEDGDTDPHGIFEYLGQADGKDDGQALLALAAYETVS